MVPTNQPESLAPSYVLDPGMSRFVVKAVASGMLSAFGHNPTIAIRSFQGEAWFRPQAPEQSSLQLVIDANSLTVTNDMNDKDRREIERIMKEEVLETSQHPEIRFDSSGVDATQISEGMFVMKIMGRLSLHGVNRDILIPCNVTISDDRLRVNGEFVVRQTDYRIQLVSVAGGTLKLKDELKFSFDIAGNRRHDSGPAHGD
jgi:polyisoprenoid-binding protein YceI